MHFATGRCTKTRIHVVPSHDGFASITQGVKIVGNDASTDSRFSNANTGGVKDRAQSFYRGGIAELLSRLDADRWCAVEPRRVCVRGRNTHPGYMPGEV
jgi:hypothetical protein